MLAVDRIGCTPRQLLAATTSSELTEIMAYMMLAADGEDGQTDAQQIKLLKGLGADSG